MNLVDALFGRLDEDVYRENIFRLCYRDSNGSGLGLNETLADIPLRDLAWYIERMDEQRARERPKS